LVAERWARRKGCGERAAKIGRGKVRAGGWGADVVVEAIVWVNGGGGVLLKMSKVFGVDVRKWWDGNFWSLDRVC
jgi:hypothetical protein